MPKERASERIPLTTRLEPDSDRLLKMVAAAEGTSASAVAALAIDQYIESYLVNNNLPSSIDELASRFQERHA